MFLLVFTELWWTNQELLETILGSIIDQKWSRCMGRIVRSPHKGKGKYTNIIVHTLLYESETGLRTRIQAEETTI
jgi:hypothetical protein